MTTWIGYNFLRDIYRRQRAALQVYGVIQIGEVADEPISIEVARAHCRVDTFLEGSPPALASDDDLWLTDIGIPAAREYCESELGVSLAPRTMELAANSFPSFAPSTPPGTGFNLPFGPVQSITSVTYIDSLGASQTMPSADYALDVYAKPARLNLVSGASWPTSDGTVNSVKVRYVVGFTIPGDSPQIYPLPKMGMAMMLLMLGHLYDNREGVAAPLQELPLGISALSAFFPGRERLGMA